MLPLATSTLAAYSSGTCTLLCMYLIAGVQMTAPEWYQQLIGHLTANQRKDLEDILQFSEQERSAQSPCLAALLSAPVV